jgi:hypothetical protein
MNDIGHSKTARHGRDDQLAVRAPAPCELTVNQVNVTARRSDTELDQCSRKDHQCPISALLSSCYQSLGLDAKIFASVDCIDDEISNAIDSTLPVRAVRRRYDQAKGILRRTHQIHRSPSSG